MPRIFVSHSSKDNRQAIALRQWLIEHNPVLNDEIFLDLDRDTGIRAGTRWKDALRQASSRCEAVIVVLSPDWEASTECRAEYRFAEYLNKRVFCAALVHPSATDPTREWQRVSLYGEGDTTEIDIGDGQPPVTFRSEGLRRLQDGIVDAGIGAQAFAWPPPEDPDRAPYRGWEPLEESDAAVFFGRDAQILAGLDNLRGMRKSGLATMFVILGPSGSGKSSFLRAGLMPRLRRSDREFLVLDIVRPQRDVITGETGFARGVYATRVRLGLTTPSLGEITDACLSDPARVKDLLREIQMAAGARLLDQEEQTPLPTLVLPLDQAEELLSADADAEATTFMSLLADIADIATDSEDGVGLIVAATLRTDRFQALQTAPQLAGVASVIFDDLKPMPATHFQQVINGPAGRATQGGRSLQVEPALVNRLLEDCTEGADTLPLLALTLARLLQYSTDGKLTLAHYEAMGGLGRVVQREIDAVLASDPQRRGHQLELLRAAFIPWLATINPDNDQPLRRLARVADLPVESRPLIESLVARRLMVQDEREGQVVVEVALESLLRQWDELAGWLREEREDLKAADTLERNTSGWESSDRDPAWLLEGTRLTDAETLSNATGFRERLAGTQNYLSASRQRENERLAADEERRQSELRNARERQQTAEAHAAILRRRSHVLRIVLALTALVAVIAVVGAVTAAIGFRAARDARNDAQSRFREATSLRLGSEAAGMLAGTRTGGDPRAFQQLLAARTLADTPDDGALYDAVVSRVKTLKIIETGTPVISVAFSPDMSRLASAEYDGTVRIFDTQSGQPIGAPLNGHQGIVDWVTFSPDGHRLASSGSNGTIRLWNVDTGEPIGQPLTGHVQNAYSVAFSPDGHRLASGGYDRTVRLWDADTGRPIGQPLTGHTDEVYSVAFSPDGHRVASASVDRTLRLWDADTGKQIGAPLTGHTNAVNSVGYSPDGSRLVSGSRDRTIRFWDAGTGQQIGEPIVDNQSAVNGVAFGPDGRLVTSGDEDGTVRLWDAETHQPARVPFAGHQNQVNGVAFSPDGRRIASASDDGTIRVWDAEIRQQLIGHQGSVNSVAFRRDGRRVASAGDDRTVRIWNTDNGQEIGQPLTGHTDTVDAVAFSPDGRVVASGSDDHTVRLWNAETSQPIGEPLIGHTDQVYSVAFSPDGHRLASAGRDRTVRLWDVDTGRPIGLPIVHRDSVFQVDFSPDGKRLASGSGDGTVRLWDADTGQPIGQPLTGHTDEVYSVAFSPDGHRLVSAGADDTVRLWDAGTGKEIGRPLLGHTDQVYNVAFSPDGHHVASAGGDNTVRLWDADTGKPIGQPLAGHTDRVFSVAFSPDGERLASGSQDAKVRLWPAVASAADLCDKLTTNPSPEQWAEWVSPDIRYREVCPGLPTAG